MINELDLESVNDYKHSKVNQDIYLKITEDKYKLNMKSEEG